MPICKVPEDKIEMMKKAITNDGADNSALVYAQNAYEAAGLTPMRFRWDLLYKRVGSRWICDNLYRDNCVDTDINDEHIDTALRQIMKSIGLDWAATKA